MIKYEAIKNISIRKIGIAFRQNAKDFCQNPRQWMARNGANLAGTLWNSGDGVQFILGAVTLSPRVLISSAINIAASSSSMIFGKKDWGVAANSALAILGTGIFLYPNLVSGDLRTCLGYAGFCGAVSFGIFSASLSKKFMGAGSSLLRNTLGRPRRMMGSALFLSRVPIIVSAAVHNPHTQWTILAPFIVWSLGDLSMSLSREEIVNKAKAVETAVPT